MSMRFVGSFTLIFFGCFFSIIDAYEKRLPFSQRVAELINKPKPDQFGTQPLPQQKEDFIRGIAKELGMTQEFEIRKMNSLAMRTVGLYNAFAYFDRYLFVSEHFFEKLDYDEQRFLIGHELTHIKQQAAFKRVGLLYGGRMANSILALSLGYVMHRKAASNAAAVGTGVGLFSIGSVVAQLSFFALARSHEKDADMQSAQKLGVARAGISFIKKLGVYAKDFPLQGTPDHSTWWKRIWLTHPSDRERENCLQVLVNEQEEIVK